VAKGPCGDSTALELLDEAEMPVAAAIGMVARGSSTIHTVGSDVSCSNGGSGVKCLEATIELG